MLVARQSASHIAVVCAALGGAIATSACAGDGARIDYARDVQPILAEQCFQCHGPDENARQADLRLDTRAGLFAVRDGAAIVAPGATEASELVRRITTRDEFERMPPADSKHALSAKQIELLVEWVERGAEWRAHWSFDPPRRPRLPEVSRRDWPANGIDHFVLARLDLERLAPSAEASKETLIRRVTLDLTGLPPTPDEVDAFLADSAHDAYDRVVDRLLASPRYGERMVWEWLDAARYADSNGFQQDLDRTMWPWRDCAVRALNANMPFDQFTIEQLAGDLLPQATLEEIVATGFNRNHMYNAEGGRVFEATRVENVVDRVDTVATVWLGLTMACARCHDHKYDPFTTREYYQLYAFFNNTSETGLTGRGRNGQVPPTVEYRTDEDRAKLARLDAQVDLASAEVAEIEARLYGLEIDGGKPGASRIVKSAIRAEEATSVPRAAPSSDLSRPPRMRTSAQLESMLKRTAEYQKALARLKEAVDDRAAAVAAVPRVMVMDQLDQPRETFVLVRGAFDKHGDQVSAGVPAVLPPLEDDAPRDRLSLARWLVDGDHPLTARVAVNRAWQQFFGVGLVKTAEDFGIQGEKPSHPELLDWLAVEFVAGGWDVKRLHRMIVTSATYRQSSRSTRALLERDPENRLLARGARYRLPSFMLRDQALSAAGLLSAALGGAPVRPYQPAGIWEEATNGRTIYEQDHGESLYRRSVYAFWRRIVGPTMFFDAGARQTCSVRASRTNTPLHALATLNDVTYVEAARALAERVMTSAAESDEQRIETAFRRVLARRPSAAEQRVLTERLAALRTHFAADRASAEKLLAVGESPRDVRLDAAEHAALADVCLLILNLDEALSKE